VSRLLSLLFGSLRGSDAVKRRLRIVVFLLAALAFALAVYTEPSQCVCGWLCGEAFFEGRPTSWWRAELDRWEISVQPQEDGNRKHFVSYHRTYSWFDALCEHWSAPHSLIMPDGGFIKPQEGPVLRLLGGSPEATPVLQALHSDRSQKIRQFARLGLGLDAEDPEMQ
jgi:hypothetical protein